MPMPFPQLSPQAILQMTQPVVAHGMREAETGTPPHHVIHEAAATGFLMGMGASYPEAVQQVEMWENMHLFRAPKK